jgi:hypothetical protein
MKEGAPMSQASNDIEPPICRCRFPLLSLDTGRCAYCHGFIPFQQQQKMLDQFYRELSPWRVLALAGALAAVIYLLGLSVRSILK